MKRTTIFADDDLINVIREISKEKNRSVADIMREVMQNYIRQKRHKKKKISFIGIGSSGRKDISELHEELLLKKTYKIDTVIVDTGIIYALADLKDSWHRRSVDFVKAFTGRLIVPSTVIPEACYLINTISAAKARVTST